MVSTILQHAKKPAIYAQGTAFMWTDEYISKQLLQAHINPEIDRASRKQTTIKRTTDWIQQNGKGENLQILDLGCGPGLYTKVYAENGHEVMGVDISANSIEYAKQQAMQKDLDIVYIQANYLELDLGENRYDLVTLVFTDFGVLNPDDQKKLLSKIFRSLKKGGLFIFDVMSDKRIQDKLAPKDWEITDSGFWRPRRYLALSESFLYEKEKVILYQHLVQEENAEVDVYRFWMHFYSEDDLQRMLTKEKFIVSGFYNDVLPEADAWNGDNVTFCVAMKPL